MIARNDSSFYDTILSYCLIIFSSSGYISCKIFLELYMSLNLCCINNKVETKISLQPFPIVIFQCISKDHTMRGFSHHILELTNVLQWHFTIAFHNARTTNLTDSSIMYLFFMCYVILFTSRWQAQMRDLSGFVETRQQLLTLKSNHRMNWIGFAVAHHLNSKYDFRLHQIKWFFLVMIAWATFIINSS
jgi:hypothetical protein